MENIVISLPREQRIYVEEQIRLGSYGNASEYFSLLVQQDRERQTKERLETMLIEGLESGPAEPMTAQDWEKIRMAVRERTGQ
ncbi:MAG: type II toxin-antitoxin system ParD family antitoxin [Hormoscilla sp. GM7CHS1pb]|nr:type II toxin-antitoxin system ParD family antitoxin [Hormoscilla sp. GM7CHS1pb]